MMNKQMFYKEIEAHFNLRTNKTKKPEMVYLVVRIDGRQYKLSCGVKVYPQQWHKGIAEESNLLCKRDNKNNKIVNEKLTVLKKRYSDFISYLCNCDNEITDMGDLLKQFIYKDMNKKNNQKEKNVLEYINEAFDSCYSKRPTKEQSKKGYRRNIKKYFIPYVQSLNDDSINVLKQEGFSKWAKWLKEQTTDNVVNNTLELIARLIREIIMLHPNLGLQLPMYDKIQIVKNTQKKNEGKPLDKKEIEALINYTPKNKMQEATQILFLIGLESGARSSDWNKFITGDYEVKEIQGEKVLLIQPKKTKRNESNYAYVTLTPRLDELIKNAKEKDIYYVDREENDNSADKGKSHKHRVIMTTFRDNLRKICETINESNSALFGEKVYVSRKGEQLIPAYKAISAHWARHTFVHECKLKGLANDIIAKKIGDSTEMIEYVYGYMDKTETAEQIINAEKQSQQPKEETVSIKPKEKTSVINGFFAYDDIEALIDMKQAGISIYDDARLKKAITVIKKSVSSTTMGKAIKILQDADKEKIEAFKKKVCFIERFIWDIGKYFADTKLYMMYQYKLDKLGLLSIKPFTDEELSMIWQQELANEEVEYYETNSLQQLQLFHFANYLHHNLHFNQIAQY